MQFCTKCKNLVEDRLTLCPHCKRSKSVRQVKPTDSVFLMKTSEFEAGELALVFAENGVACETFPVKAGLVSSVYDCEFVATDKNLFVPYGQLDLAKQVIEREYTEEELPEVEDALPQSKRVAMLIASVLAFLTIVTLLALSAGWIFQWTQK